MHYLVQLNINGPGAFAAKLRVGVASLRGSASAFSLEGIAYTVMQPGVVEVMVRNPSGNSLPNVYSGMVRRVTIREAVQAPKDITGHYRHGNVTAVSSKSKDPAYYNVEVTAPALGEARRFYAALIAGRAGRYRTIRPAR